MDFSLEGPWKAYLPVLTREAVDTAVRWCEPTTDRRAFMRPVSRTVIQTLPVSIERVFALLTDPGRMAEWLPGCAGTQSDKPLRKGVRFKVRFGERTTEFEVVDFTPPTTFGWVERGERNGWKTFFRLDRAAEATAVTVRDVWAPRSLIAWLRGTVFEKRRVNSQLEAILSNVRKILAP